MSSCVPTEIKCPSGISGFTKCEGLSDKDCDFMMKEYGCCDYSSEGKGTLPSPTDNPEDWKKCSDGTKIYIKYKDRECPPPSSSDKKLLTYIVIFVSILALVVFFIMFKGSK